MRSRLVDVLIELEDINAYLQNGCIDPLHLSCFKDYESKDHNELMTKSDQLTSTAFSAIEELGEMMKERT